MDDEHLWYRAAVFVVLNVRRPGPDADVAGRRAAGIDIVDVQRVAALAGSC
jgi:hypothetical protein